jgi:hypothetical protein
MHATGVRFLPPDRQAMRHRLRPGDKRTKGSWRACTQGKRLVRTLSPFSQFNKAMDAFNEKYGTGSRVRAAHAVPAFRSRATCAACLKKKVPQAHMVNVNRNNQADKHDFLGTNLI